MTWRPKLTAYRILVLLLPNALTIAKVVLDYKGRRKESTSIDLANAVGVAVIIYVLGQFEAYHLETLTWFFERDYAPGDALNTGEYDLRLLKPSQPTRPSLTGFRIAVCMFTCGLGTSKAIVAYRGLHSAPTTIELVLVVGVGSALFWLGLYERSEADPFPTFFSIDYGPVVFKILTSTSTFHIIGIALAVVSTYLLPGQLSHFVSYWFKPSQIPDPDTMTKVFVWTAGSTVTVGLCLLIATGPLATCILLKSLTRTLRLHNAALPGPFKWILRILTAAIFAVVYVLAHATLLCLGGTCGATSITFIFLFLRMTFSWEWTALDALAVLPPLLGAVGYLFLSLGGILWTFGSFFDGAKYRKAHASLWR